MWKKTIHGIALANIETLEYYQTRKNDSCGVEKDVCLFVEKGISNLPFFFNFPMKMYGGFIGLFSVVTTGHLPNSLSSKNKVKFLRRAQRIPFFGVLNKLIRTMIFLRLFDIVPLKKTENDN